MYQVATVMATTRRIATAAAAQTFRLFPYPRPHPPPNLPTIFSWQ